LRAVGKIVAIAGRLRTCVQPKHDHRRGHLCAGVARGNECVGMTVGLELEPQHHRAARLAANRRGRLVGHLDDVRRLDDRDPLAVCAKRRVVGLAEERVERAGYDFGASDELNGMSRIKLAEGEQRAGNGRLGSEVAPHGVQRDPRQGYASLAATRCLPP
jgi:hypothetical protein